MRYLNYFKFHLKTEYTFALQFSCLRHFLLECRISKKEIENENFWDIFDLPKKVFYDLKTNLQLSKPDDSSQILPEQCKLIMIKKPKTDKLKSEFASFSMW